MTATTTQPRHVVITGVRNPSHLIHISSYLRHLLDLGCSHLGVSYLGGGTMLGRLSVDEHVVTDMLPDDPRLSLSFPTGAQRWSFPSDRPVAYVAVGAPGLKPYARMMAAQPGRKIPIIVTDEGLGTYGDWRTRRDAWARQGVPQPWRTIRSWAVTAGDRFLTSQRWALYRHTPELGWHVNDLVAAEFHRRLGPAGTEHRRGEAVMLTQPWVLLGVTTESAYRAHLDDVATRLGQQGLRLVVRPHPAEDRSMYADFPVMAALGPAELDPQVVRAAAVVGGPSTALLNLAALHRVPATLVEPPGLGLWERLGPRQKELLATFVERGD